MRASASYGKLSKNPLLVGASYGELSKNIFFWLCELVRGPESTEGELSKKSSFGYAS